MANNENEFADGLAEALRGADNLYAEAALATFAEIALLHRRWILSHKAK